MKKLMMLFYWGAILLLSGAPLAAQNSVDILNKGPQPTNTAGCAVNPQCIPAVWSTTSNAGTDISAPITANFVFASNGGALPMDFPSGTRGQICLADTRDLTGTTLFAQIAANCQAAGGLALLLIRDSAVTAPSAIPVFVISTANGDFLRNTVGFNATTGVSNYPIRINVAKATPPANPTGQHNCPNGQAVAAYVGPGTANYNPNESLCLPAGAGQAVEPSMIVDSKGTIYVESIRGVPGGLDLWRWYKTADGGPNSDGTLPFKYEGQPDCGLFVTPFCSASGLAPGGGDGDVAVNIPDPSNSNTPNLAVVSLSAAEVTGSHSTNRADTFSTPNPATAGVPLTIACGSMASTMFHTSIWSITILGPRPKSSCNAQAMEVRLTAARWARQLTLRPSRALVLRLATSRGRSRWTTAVVRATAICTRSLWPPTIPRTMPITAARF